MPDAKSDAPRSPLIEVAELNTQLDNPSFFVVDARFRLEDTAYGQQAYDTAHIPGAVYLDLDRDLSSSVIPGATGRHPLPDPAVLEARLRGLGLRQGDIVVVYDDGPGFFAARLWWLLHWLGHQDVCLLNGGLAAWQAAGLPVTSERSVRAWPGDFVGRPDPGLVLTVSALEREVAEPGSNDPAAKYCLLDARSPERFRGEQEPLDPVAGHIPGALCLPCSANLGEDGRFLSPEHLRQRFPEPSGRPLVCYCGSGVTACHNILAAVAAGLAMPLLYAGSWSEWITQPDRPVATGE